MKVAIIDAVPEHYWADDEGRNDGVKFASMLHASGLNADLDVFCITRDEWPESVYDFDAYLLTGSPCSANQSYAWTAKLEALFGEVITHNIKLVGVCFGHQFIARLLGGEVSRNTAGWMVGAYPLTIKHHQTWMHPQQTETQLYYFNQDHITRLPDNATLIGAAPNCPFAAWSRGDRIFCVQAHPEQGIDSMQNFIAASRESIGNTILDQAEQSMQTDKPDAELWAGWIRNFLL